MDLHSSAQDALLHEYVLSRAAAPAAAADPWSASGPKSISPFVPCAILGWALHFACDADNVNDFTCEVEFYGHLTESQDFYSRLPAMVRQLFQSTCSGPK